MWNKTLEGNAYLNARIELNKLELNKNKCHRIHVGSKVQKCTKLEVHNGNMINSDDQKYLGDIISSDGKHNKNIQSRIKKSNGTISDIKVVLRELCLGQHEFKTALVYF